MKNTNIILTGFMGSGKTTVGIKLSYRLKRTFIDTDKMIEKHSGHTISELFELYGEEKFRQMETQYLQELIETARNQIISVGGGTPIREENRALLKELGTVIYLKVSPDCVYERVKNDNKRPLLATPNPRETIKQLLTKREEYYGDGADIIIDTDHRDVNELVDEIERSLE